MDRMRVAFIGLGTMGLPMARRLAADHEVAGWDVSESARARFGGGPASLGAVRDSAEIVITMLWNSMDSMDFCCFYY